VLEEYAERLGLQGFKPPPNLRVVEVVERVEFEPGVPSRVAGEAQLLFLRRAVESAL
jgi:hypothetical protein